MQCEKERVFFVIYRHSVEVQIIQILLSHLLLISGRVKVVLLEKVHFVRVEFYKSDFMKNRLLTHS